MRIHIWPAIFICLALFISHARADIEVLPGEMVYNGTNYVSQIDGLSYLRQWVSGNYVAPCYSCGQYQAGYYTGGYWSYVPMKNSASLAYNLKVDDPYFDKKVADILLLREQENAQTGRYNQRLELLQQLGITGAYQRNALASPLRLGYGNGVGYNSPGYGVTGTTVYTGNQTTFNSVVDALATPLDVNVAFQQASALNGQVLAAQDKGFSGLTNVIGTASAGQLRLAEQQNKAAIALELMKLIQPTPQTTVTTSVTGPNPPNLSVSSGAGSVTATTGQQTPKAVSRWQEARAACIQCHSGQNPAGGYNVDNHKRLSDAEQLRVVSRIFSKDESKRMPRLASDPSKVGKPLDLGLALEFVPAAHRVKAVRAILGQQASVE